MSDDKMKVDYGDGVAALDRTLRAIVLITDAAIKRLEGLGYHRGEGGIEIVPAPDGFPIYVHLDGQSIFTVCYGLEDGNLVVQGKWLKEIGKKRSRFFTWLFGK